MKIEPPFRCVSRTAIDSLAVRLNLPNEPYMQDWEYEVADPNRLSEFLSVYETSDLSEDERFALMEIIIQSFEDLNSNSDKTPIWLRIQRVLTENKKLHEYSVWYWACFDEKLENTWNVSAAMRQLFQSQNE